MQHQGFSPNRTCFGRGEASFFFSETSSPLGSCCTRWAPSSCWLLLLRKRGCKPAACRRMQAFFCTPARLPPTPFSTPQSPQLLTWELPWAGANLYQLVFVVSHGERLPIPPPDQLPGPDKVRARGRRRVPLHAACAHAPSHAFVRAGRLGPRPSAAPSPQHPAQPSSCPAAPHPPPWPPTPHPRTQTRRGTHTQTHTTTTTHTNTHHHHHHPSLQLPPGEYDALVALIQRCWAQQPEDRPAFADVIVDLR